MFELHGKNAIVTGGAKGIGRGIAHALVNQGARVLLADLDRRECARTAGALGPRAGWAACDVSDRRQVDAAVEKCAEEFGSVDILVNNAGIYPSRPFLQITQREWDRIVAVNLTGVFNFSQSAASRMVKRKKGGKIVNIASIAALVGFNGLTHYCATKGGITGFTRALALELAGQKINVNAIAPGAIETP
ncbi:SDR family oxidoreductase, partial [Candidatus Micrarchaeota archaeon]|nr:SDR family oxidoreductase [Candidatus Micrarchaeota archaeon]